MADQALTLAELDVLDCPQAYRRALELGYVSDFFEYRSAIRSARFDAYLRGETNGTTDPWYPNPA